MRLFHRSTCAVEVSLKSLQNVYDLFLSDFLSSPSCSDHLPLDGSLSILLHCFLDCSHNFLRLALSRLREQLYFAELSRGFDWFKMSVLLN